MYFAEKLNVSFSKSSGPGGQNVNKCKVPCNWPLSHPMRSVLSVAVSTKAEVRFHVNSADWLPQRVKDRLHTMVGDGHTHLVTVHGLSFFPQFKSRVTKDGELIVTCQEHRSQHRNLQTAVDKLEEIIQEASEVPHGPSDLTIARIKTL